MIKRTPRYKYKVRKTTTGNKGGDNFGITVPTVVAKKFENTIFYMSITPTSIIYESGCKI